MELQKKVDVDVLSKMSKIMKLSDEEYDNIRNNQNEKHIIFCFVNQKKEVTYEVAYDYFHSNYKTEEEKATEVELMKDNNYNDLQELRDSYEPKIEELQKKMQKANDYCWNRLHQLSDTYRQKEIEDNDNKQLSFLKSPMSAGYKIARIRKLWEDDMVLMFWQPEEVVTKEWRSKIIFKNHQLIRKSKTPDSFSYVINKFEQI